MSEKPKSAPTLPQGTSHGRDIRNKLFVGNLARKVTEFMVLKLFRRHGRIVHEEFMVHRFGPQRGEPKGFCFVEFATREEAERAKEATHGKLLLGKRLVVRFASHKMPSRDDDVPVAFEGKPELASKEVKEDMLHSVDAQMAAIRRQLAQLEKSAAKQ